jgi:hypothetical protein
MIGCDISERFIVHQSHENFFVAIHSLNEQVFQMLVEDSAKRQYQSSHCCYPAPEIARASLWCRRLVPMRRFGAKRMFFWRVGD